MKKLGNILAVLLLIAFIPACASMDTATKAPAATALDRILQKGELTVGTAASMPPYNMTTKDGKVIGYEIDMANMMAGAMGVKLNVKAMDFGKLLPALEAGQIDMAISSITITGKRNLKVAFVGPYDVTGKGLLTKEKSMAEVNDPEQINNPDTTLVALKGSTSALFVKRLIPKAKLVTVDDYQQAVEMVIQGKANAMVADYAACLVSVLQHKEAGLVAAVAPLTREPLGIALPPNDSQIVNWTRNFLNSLGSSGQLNALKKRWIEDSSWIDDLK
jgi:polar amino acid transport system substrate-binding protein